MISRSIVVSGVMASVLALAACGGDGGTSQDDSPAGATPGATPQRLGAGAPPSIEVKTPDGVASAGGATLAAFIAGKRMAPELGCIACHTIGDSGNDGPGSPLTHVGSLLTKQSITQALIEPTAPMPSYRMLRKTDPEKFDVLVEFLSQLK